MENLINNNEYQQLVFKFNAVLKVLEQQLLILGEEYLLTNKYNPIEHIKSRIKSTDSIIAKLKRKNYEVTIPNILDYINDIVGIRIVCSFKSDVYDLVKLISSSPNLVIIEEQDYIKNPKDTGYSSYHILVLVPIYLSTGKEMLKAEIQIRTMAMDFWASLDHKISYKYDGVIDPKIKDELLASSKQIRHLDSRMGKLVNKLNKNIKKN